MHKRIPKIVFIEPKSNHIHTYRRVKMPRLGSLLLGTIMEQRGFDVSVVVEDIHHPPDMGRFFEDADIVGVSTLTCTTEPCVEVVQHAKELEKTVVVGGPGATQAHQVERFMNAGADFVISGEGEGAFPELIDALRAGDDVESIQNLSFRKHGHIITNPRRPFISDLDVNPIPNWRMIEGWRPGGPTSIQTTRGCPYACTFCSVTSEFGHEYRSHSVKRVIDEVRWHIRQNNGAPPFFFFCDDLLVNSANLERASCLFRALIELQERLGVPLQWCAQVRADTFKPHSKYPNIVDDMVKAGCYMVMIGLESFDRDTLKHVRKGSTVETNLRALKTCRERGILVHGMVFYGTDADTMPAVRETVDILKEYDTATAQIVCFTPEEGTDDWRGRFKNGKAGVRNGPRTLASGYYTTAYARWISPHWVQEEVIRSNRSFYSLRQVRRPLIRFLKGRIFDRSYSPSDLFVGVIRFFAWRHMQRWAKIRENREFRKMLRDELFGLHDRFRIYQRSGGSLPQNVGIGSKFAEDRWGAVLIEFLGRRGLKTAVLGSEATAVDAVIIPVGDRENSEILSEANRLREYCREQNLPAIEFPHDESDHPFILPYEALARIWENAQKTYDHQIVIDFAESCRKVLGTKLPARLIPTEL